MTLVGTMRKNKPDIPRVLLDVRGRAAKTSKFAFDVSFTLTSYIPKLRKNVIVLFSPHHDATISDEAFDFKPEIILYYNRTKGGVDLLDMKLKYYRSGRRSIRWPLTYFSI